MTPTFLPRGRVCVAWRLSVSVSQERIWKIKLCFMVHLFWDYFQQQIEIVLFVWMVFYIFNMFSQLLQSHSDYKWPRQWWRLVHLHLFFSHSKSTVWYFNIIRVVKISQYLRPSPRPPPVVSPPVLPPWLIEEVMFALGFMCSWSLSPLCVHFRTINSSLLPPQWRKSMVLIIVHYLGLRDISSSSQPCTD